ncbi:hypothetical protein NQ318_017025 [Aromia moschata]|uniref:Uncharacterized protein n=1 Tax=Aromia moschata TaxID=1265417 RepID=A0AAV8XWI3_9CUCU|nr:hypothetical protein NQ318_017025 [Aromia moschata]
MGSKNWFEPETIYCQLPTAIVHPQPPRKLPIPPKFYKTNIKPRMAHILPKSYMSLQFDIERKRKSNLLPEIPIKRNRTPEKDEKNSG